MGTITVRLYEAGSARGHCTTTDTIHAARALARQWVTRRADGAGYYRRERLASGGTRYWTSYGERQAIVRADDGATSYSPHVGQ